MEVTHFSNTVNDGILYARKAEDFAKVFRDSSGIVTGKQVSSHDIVTGKQVSQSRSFQPRSFPVTKCFPVTIGQLS